jgi:hypothetical protein
MASIADIGFYTHIKTDPSDDYAIPAQIEIRIGLLNTSHQYINIYFQTRCYTTIGRLKELNPDWASGKFITFDENIPKENLMVYNNLKDFPYPHDNYIIGDNFTLSTVVLTEKLAGKCTHKYSILRRGMFTLGYVKAEMETHRLSYMRLHKECTPDKCIFNKFYFICTLIYKKWSTRISPTTMRLVARRN